jgi:serine/threonine protein kinase
MNGINNNGIANNGIANNEIANKYIIHNKIGNGKFGTVYKGIYKKNNNLVAIKIDNSRTSLLKNETTILKYLYDHGCRQIPVVFWYGIIEPGACLVMSFYDCSLLDYVKTTIALNNNDETQQNMSKINKIMASCIQILESIHKQYIIHRDIKPDNFMIHNSKIYIIDFGLATFYIDDQRKHIIDAGSRNCILGTPKYVSYNVHNGCLPSRRDDLISLGYMYIFMYCRELGWDNISMNSAVANNNITDEIDILHYKNIKRKELKQLENLESICKNINEQITRYLDYCYNLKYDDLPNYNALIELYM